MAETTPIDLWSLRIAVDKEDRIYNQDAAYLGRRKGVADVKRSSDLCSEECQLFDRI